MDIVDTTSGAVIPIRAMPRAGRSAIAGLRDGMLLVRLHAAPVDGAANTELIDLLSRALRVPRRDLKIVSGETGRTKRVHVSGLTSAVVLARLQPAI